MNKMPFWKPAPKRPKDDPFMWFILIPCLISALGWFVQGAFSFSFGDIKVIPDVIQSWLVVAGSTLIIFGAEINTPFVFVLAFSKIVDTTGENHKTWDATALIASLLGTSINMMVNFSLRNRAFFVDMPLGKFWINAMLAFGPILAGIAIALDYYGACVELSRIYTSFKARYEQWLEEKLVWDKDQDEQQNAGELGGIVQGLQESIITLRKEIADMGQGSIQQGESVTTLQEQITRLQYPVATLQEFKALLPEINGDYNHLEPIEQVKEICFDNGMRFDGSKRTAKRWTQELCNS
jgi:hypothetical protein